MFDNLWFVLCFLLPTLASVVISGTLMLLAWRTVVWQKPFRVVGSLLAFTLSVLCDGVALLNSLLGDKLFPMTPYGGKLEPFFYTWQAVSFVVILIALTLLIRDKGRRNQFVFWGTISQLIFHCSESVLFILLRFT